MTQNKNDIAYASRLRSVADTLVQRLLAEFKDEIHSIVLYGSVARGEATTESDVDVLVITEAPGELKEMFDDVGYDISLTDGVYIELMFSSTAQFQSLASMGSWFASDVIGEGIVLYDDGTFRRIGQGLPQAV